MQCLRTSVLNAIACVAEAKGQTGFVFRGDDTQAILFLADMIGFDLNYSGSDENMLEMLLSAAAAYISVLDDDGTRLTQLGLGMIVTEPPEHVAGSVLVPEVDGGNVLLGAAQSSERPAAVLDGESVYGFQVDVSGMPAGTTDGTSWIGVGGGFVLFNGSGDAIGVRSVAAVVDSNRGVTSFDAFDSWSGVATHGAQTIPENLSLGIYVNSATGLLGASIGETDLGYFDVGSAVGQVASAEAFLWLRYRGSADVAGTVGLALRDQAENITAAVPAGALALSGVSIAGGA